MKRTFKSMFVSLLPVFLVAISGLLAANLPARAQTAPGNAMLVLDASGSMWGQIEGISKMQIAREVVSNMLDNWNPKRNLGLMAYGHRRKGDCGDIQTLARVGPVDPVAMKALVNSLNPRGKTPISAAVRLAAEGL
ncbi:MAG: VWA domain-containing protein [Hyphomicrobiales bacterium]